MKIIILMAGEGQRFKDAGITTPKPLLEVNGKRILEWTTRSFPRISHYNEICKLPLDSSELYFAVRAEHVREFDLINVLTSIYGSNINVVEFEETTRGNLETALITSSYIDPFYQNGIIILDSDNKYEFENELPILNVRSPNDLYRPFYEASVAYFEPIDNDLKWAFVTFDENQLVTKLVEKQYIENGYPLMGVFEFKFINMFQAYGRRILDNGWKTGSVGKEEFYMTQVVQLMLSNKQRVFAHKLKNIIPLGTPEDVQRFAERNSNGTF